jgi:hypothetical protein
MAITTAMRTEVTQLYVSLFGRAPEAAGMAYWVNQLDRGVSVYQVAQDMYNVDAARAYYPMFLTNQEIVGRFYQNVLGRTADAEGLAYWTAQLDGGKTQGQVIVDMVNAVVNYSGTNEAALTSKALFNNKVEVGNYYAVDVQGSDVNNTVLASVTADAATVTAAKAALAVAGMTQNLTSGTDHLGGTAGNDTYSADLSGNADTLNSGDVIAAGAGTDVLKATLGDGSTFAVLPTVTGVEHFMLQAQDTNTGDGGDNNVGGQGAVQLDFQRVSDWNKGALVIENNNSRADLIVEDVRLRDDEITSDATIVMRQSDPGNADYGVYFDQHSLRAAPATSSGAVLNLELMDTRSAADDKDPLANSPFNGVRFTFGGETITLQSQAFDTATTYAQLLTAVQALVAENTTLAGKVTAAISGTFQAFDTESGDRLTGSVITLTNTGSEAFGEGSYTTADGTTPASGGYHTVQNTTPGTATGNLITSTIVLDDVGRGSMGGDLVVGGLSTGATSDSQGVQQFNISVERASELQTINSTANTLREVYLTNATGFTGGLRVTGVTAPTDAALAGSAAQNNWAGFSDVRVVDGSAMKGVLNLTAELTSAVVAKYMDRVDDATDASADNAKFAYTLGENNDVLQLGVSAVNLAAAGSANREDFVLNVEGGAGDDSITIHVDSEAGGVLGALASNNLSNWYDNQVINANMSVAGGAGNDTINTLGAGDYMIDGGAGNDTIYTDNAGTQMATYAFNTTATGLRLSDLESNAAASVSGVNLALTVNFRGLTSKVDVGTTKNATSNQTVSDLTINQAIKNAINNDSVLSKLLVAQDGPARTLVVTSLIDGQQVATDLAISFQATALNSTQSGISGLVAVDTTNALFGRYTTSQFALDDTTPTANAIDGNDSFYAGDNTVIGGTGDDVIVLGTDDNGLDGYASNETVKFEAAFGKDVVVNFDAGTGAGADQLDFRAFLKSGTATTLDNSIDALVNSEIDVVAQSNANDTAAEIAALYNAVDGNTAVNQLLVTYDTANVGTVYQVVDGTGADDVTVTLLGSVDLADTAWNSLLVNNFA